MSNQIVKNILTGFFGVSLFLCIYVLLFRNPSNTNAIVTVIGLLIGVLLLTVFLEQLSEFTIGPLKAKVRDHDKQLDEQQETIKAISTALLGIVTKFEYDKLKGLKDEGPFICKFHENLPIEMKRLFDHGFVQETEFGTGPKLEQYRHSDQGFDLKMHYLLTDTGRKYIENRHIWENKN